MGDSGLRYDVMVEAALRGVMRDALTHVARNGLPGAHHFYLSFRTGHPGVQLDAALKARFPDEMTIVLQHQFWDLKVEQDGFAVTLSFSNAPQRLVVPFAAVTAFNDPSVNFGLQFQSLAERTANKPTDRPLGDAVPGSHGTPKPAPENQREAQRESQREPKAVKAGQGQVTPLPKPAGPAGGGDKVVTLDSFRKK